MTNPRISAELRYPLTLKVDGLGSYDDFTAVHPFAEPYGHVDRIQYMKDRYGGDKFFSENFTQTVQVTPDQQHVSVFAFIYIPVWNHSVVYDPEFRLNLLFDPSMASPATPEAREQEKAGLGAALTAVIVIAVVVVVAAAAIAVFRFVIFPYRNRENETEVPSTALMEDEEASTASPAGAKTWSVAKRPDSVARKT